MKTDELRSEAVLAVDPAPRHEISPYLFMQFMEPLGEADPSVEAGWDFLKDCWRPDFVAATRELAPTLIRWGGIFSSYYRWKEGVGPFNRRKTMLNRQAAFGADVISRAQAFARDRAEVRGAATKTIAECAQSLLTDALVTPAQDSRPRQRRSGVTILRGNDKKQQPCREPSLR